MGVYYNPGNNSFAKCLKSKTFVDKTGLIQRTNSALGTEKSRIVVSRPRRFGKTMAISMLKAYYSCGCDSRDLFHGLAIESDPFFEEHLNKHSVISFDVQGLFLKAKSKNRKEDLPSFISETINAELAKEYPDEVHGNESSLSSSLAAIHATHDSSFIFLLDEWDVIYREEKCNEKLKHDFTGFLKDLFKDSEASHCIELVYQTGIYPIPKAEIESGLHNFSAYTMLDPLDFAAYVGFTEAEVDSLCQKNQMPLQDLKAWYEGYPFGSVGSVYCPYSVVNAIQNRKMKNYWGKTAAATVLTDLIHSADPRSLKAVQALLSGASVDVTLEDSGPDLSDLGSLDASLTALVHLGYLAYQEDHTVRIPNQEVADEFRKAIRKVKRQPA